MILFSGYQLYRIALHPTAGLAVLTVFNLAIVLPTWREFRQQQRRRGHQGPILAPDDKYDATANRGPR